MEFLSGAVRKKNVFPVVNRKVALCVLDVRRKLLCVICVFAYHMLLDRVLM